MARPVVMPEPQRPNVPAAPQAATPVQPVKNVPEDDMFDSRIEIDDSDLPPFLRKKFK